METVRVLRTISRESFATNRDRIEAVNACQALLTRLQDPFERVWEIVIDVPALTASVKLCLDIGLFQSWKESGDTQQSCRDLAKMIGFKQVDVLSRILKHLAAHAVVEEVTADTYKQTRFSDALLTSAGAGIDYFYDTSAKLYLNLPEYFRSHSYDPPSGPRDGLFQRTFACQGLTAFDFYGAPEQQDMSNTFNEWLKAYRLHRDPWTDLYPPENILAGYSQGPLIVDVGGNLGEDLELFRRKYPAHGQQLILQDLPDKVARATCSAEVQRMAHNFFTAQPKLARGARVIIHDWDDSDAGRILGHIRDAMIPGYSKLLINDVIIPVRQPSRRDTSVDVHMMVKLGGRERTDDMLRGLVEKLGLKVCGGQVGGPNRKIQGRRGS
ncbi:O-methyltransferase, family 2 [Metarhizium album ARSEF 1941]|uniref:O-methyltransferase, family 2 n=1 Tax=Metarhizium album (strain ARSEF 1941) TaxID=1081103 RepID=A0A0B2WIM9_METAS|nr:O-methyltransferase, family 2 [Metarhizium album ARSEF 1941]KHN93708.1 O-methyltransferase, family 2 [Metarhizium album ARSEF 1941]